MSVSQATLLSWAVMASPALVGGLALIACRLFSSDKPTSVSVETQVTKAGEPVVVCAVDGPVTDENLEMVEGHLSRAVSGHDRAILDLTKVSYINEISGAWLVRLSVDRELVVCADAKLRLAIELLGIQRFLSLERSLEKALGRIDRSL